MICGFVVQLETEAVDRECDYKVCVCVCVCVCERERERERERVNGEKTFQQRVQGVRVCIRAYVGG